MAKITYITSDDILNDKPDISAVPGYCLVEMRTVYLTYPTHVMGGYYTCPCCGLLDETDKYAHHVVNPRAPLIAALEMGKSNG